MSTLILRNDKGTPLTYQEADDNLTNILVAIGGTNTAPYTLPTPSGTGNPVLTSGPTVDSPRITTSLFVGPSEASNLTRFPNSLSIVTNRTATPQNNESHNIGLIAEGTANAGDTAIYGIGVYGKGYTNSATRSSGVVGEGHVTLTGDTGSAIGVRGYANDTHAGGLNIGLYGDATGGSSNYALYMNAGNIWSTAAQTWTLGGNLTLSGAFTTTIPSLILGAGTTSNAPIKLTSGTNISTPVAGALEFDGTNLSFINDTTVGRGFVPVRQQFRLTTNGTSIGIATALFFGANSAISLSAATQYEIECWCYFTRITAAGTVAWQAVFSTAPTVAYLSYDATPITGFTTTLVTGASVASSIAVAQNLATITTAASGSQTLATNHIHRVIINVITNTACNFRLNAVNSAASITPLAGSYYTVRKVMSNLGTFVA